MENPKFTKFLAFCQNHGLFLCFAQRIKNSQLLTWLIVYLSTLLEGANGWTRLHLDRTSGAKASIPKYFSSSCPPFPMAMTLGKNSCGRVGIEEAMPALTDDPPKSTTKICLKMLGSLGNAAVGMAAGVTKVCAKSWETCSDRPVCQRSASSASLNLRTKEKNSLKDRNFKLHISIWLKNCGRLLLRPWTWGRPKVYYST